jgi:peptidoglycan/xylan/chitin deacetylase (PgdA/CDA1 family)
MRISHMLKRGMFNPSEFTTLPTWLKNGNGTLIEGFENKDDWTLVGTEAAIADDTTNFVQGTQSVKVTNGSTVTVTITKNSLGWDFSAMAFLTIAFYVEDATKVAGSIGLFLSNTNATYTAYFRKYMTVKTGWNYHHMHKTDFSTVGSPSWDNPINSIRMYSEAVSEQTINISFDALYREPATIPAVLFTFDDGYSNIYDVAYAYMRPRRIPGTTYVISDNLSGALLTQSQAMYASGWDMGNHTKDHTNLTTLTEAQQETELSTAKTVLDAAGFTRASAHVAYPGGTFDANTTLAMAATGMLTGRLATVGKYPLLPPLINYQMPITRELKTGVLLSTATGDIDTAIARGSTCIFLAHSLVATASTAVEWNIADFYSLIDYVVSKRLHCITISQLYSLISGPTQAYRPWAG